MSQTAGDFLEKVFRAQGHFKNEIGPDKSLEMWYSGAFGESDSLVSNIWTLGDDLLGIVVVGKDSKKSMVVTPYHQCSFKFTVSNSIEKEVCGYSVKAKSG